MARRQTIKKDENGLYWIRAYALDAYGKNKSKRFKGYSNRHEIEADVARWKAEIKQSDYIEPENITMKELAGRWDLYHAMPNSGVLSRKNQLRNIKNHILPFFKDRPVAKIRRQHIHDFLTYLQQKMHPNKKNVFLAPSTIGNIYGILKKLLNFAVIEEYIVKSPAIGVNVKKITDGRAYKTIDKAQVLEESEENALRKALEDYKTCATHWKLWVKIALETGMREGEILALEWKHILWKERIIEVNQSYNHFIDGKPDIRPPKTGKKRKITVCKSLLRELKQYREENKVIPLFDGHNFIFSDHSGKPYSPLTIIAWFKRFLKKNNFKMITIHGLRHTHATFLISKNMDLNRVARRLGHSNPIMTLRVYSHWTKENDEKAAELYERKWKKLGG